MIDNKIETFLTLCDLMNYRKTAEALNMTQPAVTQHIHGLERRYGEKLFQYNGRTLSKTSFCFRLERHARSVVYNELLFCRQQLPQQRRRLAVGATKTIGDYLLDDMVLALLDDPQIEPTVIVENTHVLLGMLDNFQLDFVMLEGYFDKGIYGHRLMERQRLVGICGKNHPFAGRAVMLEELFGERLILREEGSGTRNIFQHFLQEKNYSLQQFSSQAVLSSFKLIELAVERGRGISFVYQPVGERNDGIATFELAEGEMVHEFNYVFLKNTGIAETIDRLQGK